MHPTPVRQPRGFTLIELVSVVAVLGIIIALAAPSFSRMIEMQRLRGVQAQLVTDLQFARSESTSRNLVLRLDFRNTNQLSCYTLYTAPPGQGGAQRCDCTLGAGNACSALPGHTEVRTVQVPASTGVTVLAQQPADLCEPAFGYDPRTGGLLSNPTTRGPQPINSFRIDVYLDNARRLRTMLVGSGRPSVCAPTQSTMPEAACPAAPPCQSS